MYVSHWLRKLASTPRHSLFSPRGSVLESVEEEMKVWSTRTGVTNVETDLKEEVKVFGDNKSDVWCSRQVSAVCCVHALRSGGMLEWDVCGGEDDAWSGDWEREKEGDG